MHIWREKNMGEKRKVGKIRCPRCNSSWTRTNVKFEEHVCKHCGYKWDVEKEASMEW